MKKSKVKAEFIVVGENFDPDRLTQVLEVEPTCKGRKGELQKGKKVPNIEDFWELSTNYEESWDSDEQLELLLEQLNPNKEKLVKFIEDNYLTVVISLVIHIESGKAPGIGLSKDALQFAAALNARLDIDTYVMSDMSQEEFDKLPPMHPSP